MTPRRSLVSLALALLAPLGVTGCESVVDGARDEFSKSFTCPLERVEGRARADVRPSDLTSSRSSPPADIAADPARLAMWNARRDQATQSEDKRSSVIELRGCGHQVLYACHPFKGVNKFFCMTREYPKGETPSAW